MRFRYGAVLVDIEVRVGSTELRVGEKYVFTCHDEKRIAGTVIQLSKPSLTYDDGRGNLGKLQYTQIAKAKPHRTVDEISSILSRRRLE